MIGTGLSMVAVISERRMNRLTNPALSMGLPPFLTKKPGLNSGMMLAQYTADALIVETRILSHPAANQSIPAAADIQWADFPSVIVTWKAFWGKRGDVFFWLALVSMISGVWLFFTVGVWILHPLLELSKPKL